MKLRITTPEQSVIEADNVDGVYARIEGGEVGILPGHIPMVAPLEVGVVRYEQSGKKESVAVMGGMIHTNGDVVTLVADAAEAEANIDVMRAEKAKERAQARLKQTQGEVDLERAKMALLRAETRIKTKKTPVS